MKYAPQRYEKMKDAQGNVTNIFLSVFVDDEAGNILNHEYWLAPDEVASVVADETAIAKIWENVAAEGVVKLEETNKAKPKPPVIADQDQLKAVKIKSAEVDRKAKKIRDDMKADRDSVRGEAQRKTA